jgi:hypothetical protein
MIRAIAMASTAKQATTTPTIAALLAFVFDTAPVRGTLSEADGIAVEAGVVEVGSVGGLRAGGVEEAIVTQCDSSV